MRMKLPRRLLLLLPIVFISCLVLSAAFVVFAHPGSTNADGGHYNHSTGEYHYHHGYPQHNHEDRDGDGVLDCPYEFDDQSDHSYHGDSDSVDYDYDYDYDYDWNVDYDIPAIIDEPDPTPSPTPVPKEDDSPMSCPLWIEFLLLFLLIGLIICVFVARHYRNEEKRLWFALQEAHRQSDQSRKDFSASVHRDLTDLNELLISAYGESFLAYACGMPESDKIGSDNLPYVEDHPSLRWGTKYTLYFNHISAYVHRTNHKRLHMPSCRYAQGGIPVNAYEVKKKQETYIPCQICCPTLPDMEWVDNYIKYKDILTKRYNLDQSQKK